MGGMDGFFKDALKTVANVATSPVRLVHSAITQKESDLLQFQNFDTKTFDTVNNLRDIKETIGGRALPLVAAVFIPGIGSVFATESGELFDEAGNPVSQHEIPPEYLQDLQNQQQASLFDLDGLALPALLAASAIGGAIWYHYKKPKPNA